MRILLLEDDPILRATLAEELEDEGYAVLAVGRGLEAVEAARRQRFDLMLTDVRMEGMDGLEALERVRLLQPGLPALVITGYACAEDMQRARRLASRIMSKPCDLGELLDAVGTLAGRTAA
jgi:CheY-like chemotaxis protein